MKPKKYKQIAVDEQTHEDLTTLAKSTGRTRMGLVRWILDQQKAPARRNAANTAAPEVAA